MNQKKSNNNIILNIASLVIVALFIFVANKGINLGNKWLLKNNQTKIISDTSITIVQYIDSTQHIVNNNTYKTVSETIINNESTTIDTPMLINEYMTQRVYEDFYSDSNIYINILDTLYQNKLNGRKITYKNLKPTTTINKTINNTILKPVSGFYAGVGYANGLVPNINYINKNFLIGTGASFNNSKIQPYININFKIK